MIAGGLDLFIENQDWPETRWFCSLLQEFGLVWHEHEDWLIITATRDNGMIVAVKVAPPALSGHGFVALTTLFVRETPIHSL